MGLEHRAVDVRGSWPQGRDMPPVWSLALAPGKSDPRK